MKTINIQEFRSPLFNTQKKNNMKSRNYTDIKFGFQGNEKKIIYETFDMLLFIVR